ncbi:MAG: protein phosphatase 2C domain-containing protein [Myxococcota bacterium]
MGARKRTLSGATTHVGRVRRNNEDTFLVRPDLGLWLVADGMGGHRSGDVASTLVRLSIADFFEVTAGETSWDATFTSRSDDAWPAPARRLAASIRKANHDVFAAAASHIQRRGMGSTVVACHIDEAEPATLHVAHVGDSRCYRMRNRGLEQLTSDHSLVNEALAIDPTMTPEELARLPQNIITRALGMEATVEVELTAVDVAPGDTYILCSDGLSGLLSREEMRDAVALVDDASEVCEVLVAMANEAGGNDNVTAVALKV